MSRPPLPVGTGGKVTTRHHTTKREGQQWEAYCSFRDLDGKTRKVSRWGPSEQRARRRLAEALRDRIPPAGIELTTRSRFADAAELWITDVRARRAARTVQAYDWVLSCHALPALGELRLAEIGPARLNGYMNELAARGFAAATRRNIKTVVSGVLGEAVAHGVLPSNPAKVMRRIEENHGVARKAVRALSPDERGEFLARLDSLRCAHHLDVPERAEGCRMCRAARGDLPDLVRFMLGTGVRIGEGLATRWCDVQVATVPATASVGPTLVRVPKVGLVRQGEGKTRAATRTILLPNVVVAMLTLRRPAAAADDDPLFPSTAHTWWDPASASKALRKARTRVGFEWVTSHVFRKTAATILDDAGLSARQIADQLGHTRPSMTQDVYLGRGAPNPAAAAALDEAYRDRT